MHFGFPFRIPSHHRDSLYQLQKPTLFFLAIIQLSALSNQPPVFQRYASGNFFKFFRFQTRSPKLVARSSLFTNKKALYPHYRDESYASCFHPFSRIHCWIRLIRYSGFPLYTLSAVPGAPGWPTVHSAIPAQKCTSASISCPLPPSGLAMKKSACLLSSSTHHLK